MYRINKIVFCSIIFFFLTALPLQAGWLPWGPATLVSIGGEDYTADDFKSWWENWREKDMQLPEDLTPFVDWHLLFNEAERMKLYESPSYRRKVMTFLKARTLMQLKGEEIDRKIKISDDDLWKQYLKTQAPQYKLNIFFFKNEKTAQGFVEKFGQETVDSEEFASRHGRPDGYYSQRSEWYRPLAINPGWLSIIHDLKKGTMSQPVSWKKDFVVLRLEDKVEGTRNDFELVKKQLQKTVWELKENELTIKLLAELRKKYKVKVNSERVEQLDIMTADKDLSDEPLIFTSNGNISEKLVVAKMRQLHRFRSRNGFKENSSLQFKNQVVNGIIDQTLTSWEALARKYEQKPPFEAVYQFYCQHRMIKLLEEKLFSAKAAVSQEEIESYYKNNIVLFTQPEVVRMAIVEGSQEDLDALWLEVAMGGDFILLAQHRTGQDIPVREIPVNHLNPKVKEVLDKLTTNEVSQVFTVDNHVSLVQLIEHKAAQVMPLAEVQETIRGTLHTAKLASLRKDYLNKLREEYEVESNETVWQDLKKEMEQLDETP